MFKDRVFILSHLEEVKKKISDICKLCGVILEETQSIHLDEDFIWLIDEPVWLEYQILNSMEDQPWNVIILSENDEDFQNHVVKTDHLDFLKYVLKYPFLLKYKKILVLDDDINQLRLIKTLLKSYGFIPYCILNSENLEKGLKTKPDLIILDLYGNETKNDAICRKLKADYVYHDIPVIFLSASERRQDILDVLDSGANDFIKKPFFSEELLARVGVQLRILYMYDENQKFLTYQEQLSKKLMDLLEESRMQRDQIAMMNKMLKRKSVTDPLTQIFNRGYLFAVMQREIEVVKRYKKNLSAIMFDLDFFKNINDTYGHLVGDNILKGFVEVVKKRVRTSDLLSRYGGEEFVLLLTDTDAQNAFKVAEDIRKLLETSTFKTKDKIKIKVTASGGVTSYIEDEEMDVFFNRLDQALYRAKETGRNRVVLL